MTQTSFKLLHQEILTLFHSIGKKVLYKKDSVIFYEGDESETVYILLQGEVKSIKFYDTKEEFLDYYKGTVLIGEVACISGHIWPFSAIATSDCEIIECQRKEILKLIFSSQDATLFVLNSLIEKIQSLQDKVHGYPGTCQQKIARYIDLNCQENEKISVKKIAEFFCCQYETVSRIMTKLENLGAIVRKRNMLLKIDKEKLKEIYFL